MTEANIILGILAFILGSMQYQIRIRLSDAKEDILRTMRYYSSRGEQGSLSLNQSINMMRSLLKKRSLSSEQAREFNGCIKEYDDIQRGLKFTGIYVPAIGLIVYLAYRAILVWMSYSKAFL